MGAAECDWIGARRCWFGCFAKREKSAAQLDTSGEGMCVWERSWGATAKVGG